MELWRVVALAVLIGIGIWVGPASRAEAPRPLATETLSRAGRPAPGFEVVTHEAAWRALWEEMVEPGPRPAVDWRRRFVVAAFLGQQPTGGYAIEVVGIQQRGREIAVHVQVRRPEPGALVTMALTYPGHVVAAERPPSGSYTVTVYGEEGRVEARRSVQL